MTLKQQDCDCQIDVIAPAWSVPLLKRMPEVNQAIELPIAHKQLKLLTRYRLGKSLRNREYDRAIVTPRSFKSALVPFFARARQRTGYRGEHRYGLLNDIRPLNKSILRQTVQRYVALAQERDSKQAPAVPYPSLTVDKTNQARLVEKFNLDTSKKLVAMMPGAEYGPAKQWPPSYYRELALQLLKQDVQVIILGSAREQSLGEEIAADKQIFNLCGRTELVDVIDLLALVQCAVTNDSGLMHIAAATGVPVVAIYGSSDPQYTPPLTDNARIMYKNLSCSPCFKRTCPLGHLNCLNTISIDEVNRTIAGMLWPK